MKHSRKDRMRRAEAFATFLKSNPPRPGCKPAEYARIAFITGWNSGQADLVERYGEKRNGLIEHCAKLADTSKGYPTDVSQAIRELKT